MGIVHRYSIAFLLCGLFFGALLSPLSAFAQSYGDGNFGDDVYGGSTSTPPTVSITAPSNGASVAHGSILTITASASDSDGTVSYVDFLIDDLSIGTSSSPFTKNWTASDDGSHVIKAVATDNNNKHATSSVTITVTEGSSGGNDKRISLTDQSQEEAPSAKIASLQKIIAGLLQQLEALRSGDVPTVESSADFLADLEVGSVGDDVKRLQQFLNSQGFLVDQTGAGSLGSETTYFGTHTRDALAKFQTFYNIAPAVGYFGPLTRAKVNSLLE